MSMEEFDYFFSYSRDDSEFVLKLAKHLRSIGANLWLDQLDILGGQHWDSTVENALKNCKGMIAVLSPAGVESKNVMDEVSYALEEGKLVVPVLLHTCEIPFRLRRVQHIDFTGDYDTGFSQLLKALRIEPISKQNKTDSPEEEVVSDSSTPPRPASFKRPAAVAEDPRSIPEGMPQHPLNVSKRMILKIMAVVAGSAMATFAIFATLSDTGVLKISERTMAVLIAVSVIVSGVWAIRRFR